jgi:hypothetical protein
LQSTVLMLKQAVITQASLLGTPKEYELVHGCKLLKNETMISDTQIFDKYRPKLVRVRASPPLEVDASERKRMNTDPSFSVQVRSGSQSSPANIQVFRFFLPPVFVCLLRAHRLLCAIA